MDHPTRSSLHRPEAARPEQTRSASFQNLATAAVLCAVSALILFWNFPELFSDTLLYNDGIAHLSFIRKFDAFSRWDFWYDTINFGHALFRSYQSLLHVLVWALWKGFHFLGFPLSLERSFNIGIIVIQMLIPWTSYIGFRWLRLPRDVALYTAVLLPFLQEQGGFGMGMGNFNFSGFGTFTQCLSMLFIPLALGSLYRFLREPASKKCFSKWWLRSTLFFSLTFLSHIIFAYFIAVWVAVDALYLMAVSEEKFTLAKTKEMLKKLLCFGVATLGVLLPWLVPMIADHLYQHRSTIEPAYKWEGYGIGWVLTNWFDGKLLDYYRFPVLSIFSMLGIFMAGVNWILKKREQSRWLFVLFAAWFIISAGPKSWGIEGRPPFFMPFAQTVHWHRAFGMLQYLLLIAAAMATLSITNLLAGSFSSLNKRRQNALAVLLLMLPLIPLMKERTHYYLSLNKVWLKNTTEDWNQNRWAQDLLEYLKKGQTEGKVGRVFAGTVFDFGNRIKATRYIPLYAAFTQFGVENLGSIYLFQNFSSTFGIRSNWASKEQNRFANLTHVVLPNEFKEPKYFTKLNEGPSATLYATGVTPSYFDIGLIEGTSCISSTNTEAIFDAYAKSDWIQNHRLLEIQFRKTCDGEATPVFKTPSPVGLLGTLSNEKKEFGLQGYIHTVTVNLPAKATLYFKSNYHPGWIASLIDSKTGTREPLTVRSLAPSYLGVELEKGIRTVEMQYAPESSNAKVHRELLWAISFFSLFSIVGITCFISLSRNSS